MLSRNKTDENNMSELRMIKKQKLLILLMTTNESADHNNIFYTFQELSLFLIKYSFILYDNTIERKFFKRVFYPHGEIFFQNSNGARYLDPKYSRWISVDPAFGEYVPSAGKSNEADKLPGMGGIYNSVNLCLYHYAGNNPVKYVDPDGRRDMTAEEKRFATEILGDKAPLDTRIYQDETDFGSISLPTGDVFIQKSKYSDSMTDTSTQVSELMHELYHQVQYAEDDTDIKISLKSLLFTGPGVGSLKLRLLYSIEAHGSFPKLLNEFVADELLYILSDHRIVNYVYNYGDILKYKRLSNLPYLESQASFIEDFSNDYYLYRYSNFKPIESQKNLLKKQAQIMEASGIKSEATRWVLEDL